MFSNKYVQLRAALHPTSSTAHKAARTHTHILQQQCTGGTPQSFSSDLWFVSSSLVSLHVCLAAFSSAPADFPLKRSRCGRK